MRNAFISALMVAAERDERIWLLTGDLGYSVLEPFERRFPDRYVNVGIAEQNMTGVAAGLAMAGKIPVTYSIANFPTLRCLEQIRNDVCYHGLNVKVVAVGGGLAYGSLGYTHHAVEDLAILRTLPGMAVAAPGDPAETTAVVEAALDFTGPTYIRLGKAGEPTVHPTPVRAPLGEPIVVREGADLTLVSTGAVLPLVVAAADRLGARGLQAAVISVPWVSPIHPSSLLRFTGAPMICVEEHVQGGLFAALAEAFSDAGLFVPMRSVRLQSRPAAVSGSQDSLRSAGGVSIEAILQASTRSPAGSTNRTCTVPGNLGVLTTT